MSEFTPGVQRAAKRIVATYLPDIPGPNLMAVELAEIIAEETAQAELYAALETGLALAEATPLMSACFSSWNETARAALAKAGN